MRFEHIFTAGFSFEKSFRVFLCRPNLTFPNRLWLISIKLSPKQPVRQSSCSAVKMVRWNLTETNIKRNLAPFEDILIEQFLGFHRMKSQFHPETLNFAASHGLLDRTNSSKIVETHSQKKILGDNDEPHIICCLRCLLASGWLMLFINCLCLQRFAFWVPNRRTCLSLRTDDRTSAAHVTMLFFSLETLPSFSWHCETHGVGC